MSNVINIESFGTEKKHFRLIQLILNEKALTII
jgi:hypothetical protein